MTNLAHSRMYTRVYVYIHVCAHAGKLERGKRQARRRRRRRRERKANNRSLRSALYTTWTLGADFRDRLSPCASRINLPSLSLTALYVCISLVRAPLAVYKYNYYHRAAYPFSGSAVYLIYTPRALFLGYYKTRNI